MQDSDEIMKTITIDDDVYAYIASNTQAIGESASDILRRLLQVPATTETSVLSVSIEPEPQQQSKASDNETEALTVNEASLECHNEADNIVVAQNIEDVLELIEAQITDNTSSVVERFLLILSVLHHVNTDTFERILAVKGRNRLYFAKSKQELTASGSSTNPKQVPNSEYWVVTNNNTSKKSSMLMEVLNILGYTNEQAELFKPLLN